MKPDTEDRRFIGMKDENTWKRAAKARLAKMKHKTPKFWCWCDVCEGTEIAKRIRHKVKIGNHTYDATDVWRCWLCDMMRRRHERRKR